MNTRSKDKTTGSSRGAPYPSRGTRGRGRGSTRPAGAAGSSTAPNPVVSTRTNPKDNYVFFWKIHEPHGYLSQWYHSPFTARIHFSDRSEPSTDLVTFPTAEHYMMASKALLFNDPEVYRKVMETPDDLMRVKSLGREVKGFVEDVWVRHREEIVLNASLGKFRERGNEEIRRRLLETGDRVLVEASPRDKIWGVGFGEQRALEMKQKWGLNLLGIALMETRKRLKAEGEGVKEGTIEQAQLRL